MRYSSGDAVQIVDWDEDVLTGEVVAVYPDTAYHCDTPGCCGTPCDTYDILLQNGKLEERVPEQYVHPRSLR